MLFKQTYTAVISTFSILNILTSTSYGLTDFILTGFLVLNLAPHLTTMLPVGSLEQGPLPLHSPS